MSHFSLILMVCVSAILFSGCAKDRTAVINMQTGMSAQSIMPESRATVEGRTIRFGDETKDNFGPSFDFDKLR